MRGSSCPWPETTSPDLWSVGWRALGSVNSVYDCEDDKDHPSLTYIPVADMRSGGHVRTVTATSCHIKRLVSRFQVTSVSCYLSASDTSYQVNREQVENNWEDQVHAKSGDRCISVRCVGLWRQPQVCCVESAGMSRLLSSWWTQQEWLVWREGMSSIILKYKAFASSCLYEHNHKHADILVTFIFLLSYPSAYLPSFFHSPASSLYIYPYPFTSFISLHFCFSIFCISCELWH